MPGKYRQWKKDAEDQLKLIWIERDLPTFTKEQPITMAVEAHGPGRCDADNLLGALLDSGLPNKKTGWRGCWSDDRVTVIPSICFTWIRDSSQFWIVSLSDFEAESLLR